MLPLLIIIALELGIIIFLLSRSKESSQEEIDTDRMKFSFKDLKAQFIEPVTSEEKVKKIFNIKE